VIEFKRGDSTSLKLLTRVYRSFEYQKARDSNKNIIEN